MDWNTILELEYPHWLIVAGAALVAVGSIGFAFQRARKEAKAQEVSVMGKPSRAEPLPRRQLPTPPSQFTLDPRD